MYMLQLVIELNQNKGKKAGKQRTKNKQKRKQYIIT